jgi:DNA polymerase-3 subunit epsilon
MLYLGPSALKHRASTHLEHQINNWQQFYRQQAHSARHPLLRRFYQAGMVSADTPLHSVPLLALDFETTGLNPANSGIVSIGLLPMDLTQIYASKAQQWLLKPRFSLSDESVTLHRITHTDIEQAPDLCITVALSAHFCMPPSAPGWGKVFTSRLLIPWRWKPDCTGAKH